MSAVETCPQGAGHENSSGKKKPITRKRLELAPRTHTFFKTSLRDQSYGNTNDWIIRLYAMKERNRHTY